MNCIVYFFSICSQMAEHALSERDYDKAINAYKEALIYNESDSVVCKKKTKNFFINYD